MAGTRKAAELKSRSIYGRKNARPRTFTLTVLSEEILDAATERTKASASNIVEHLLRLHGGQVTAEEMAPGAGSAEGAEA